MPEATRSDGGGTVESHEKPHEQHQAPVAPLPGEVEALTLAFRYLNGLATAGKLTRAEFDEFQRRLSAVETEHALALAARERDLIAKVRELACFCCRNGYPLNEDGRHVYHKWGPDARPETYSCDAAKFRALASPATEGSI